MKRMRAVRSEFGIKLNFSFRVFFKYKDEMGARLNVKNMSIQ